MVETIKNSEANHLGMPIPAGRLRVYRRDTDGQVQFVGESMVESFEVKLSNQRTQAVTVHVIEPMERETWKITAKSADFVKKDAFTADFAVVVQAKGEAVLTYSVHSSW